jgi:hypothetical protein
MLANRQDQTVCTGLCPSALNWLAMYVHMRVCAFETWAEILDIQFPNFQDGYSSQNVGLLAI